METIWIIDYDDTLIPTSLIGKYINNNNKMDFFTLNNLLINFISIYLLLDKIKNNTVYILTASLSPWVSSSLDFLHKILINNIENIDINYIKKNTKYYDNNIINKLLYNETNILTNMLDDFVKIYYVSTIENDIYDNTERHNKYNSMKFIIDLNDNIDNVISVGDNYNNEGKVTIKLSEEYPKKIFKFIKFDDDQITYLSKLDELRSLIDNIKLFKNDKTNSIYTKINI